MKTYEWIFKNKYEHEKEINECEDMQNVWKRINYYEQISFSMGEYKHIWNI